MEFGFISIMLLGWDNMSNSFSKATLGSAYSRRCSDSCLGTEKVKDGWFGFSVSVVARMKCMRWRHDAQHMVIGN